MHDSPREAGFTMIELMVVVMILALLATMVGTNVFHSSEASRLEIAQAQVRNHFQTAQGYYLRHAAAPDPLSLLTRPDPKTGEPLLHSLDPDPWGNNYRLVPGDRPSGFQIASDGPDGSPDTEDDIRYPRRD